LAKYILENFIFWTARHLSKRNSKGTKNMWNLRSSLRRLWRVQSSGIFRLVDCK